MRASQAFLLSAAIGLGACEDGPQQIFSQVPEGTDPRVLNGDLGTSPWTPDGERGFGARQGGDKTERARFCDEAEQTAQVQEMVKKPIIPDVSVGGVPMWAPDGGRLSADDLLGRPEDGKFCDPTTVYADAFTWGPTNEIIVFFDQDTRLVDGVVAYTQYLGTLAGSYTDAEGQSVPIELMPRERVKIDGQELDQYSSRADQAERPGSWLNNQNITKIYRMVRESFFDAQPFADDYDCVAAKICDVDYSATNDAVPQETWVILQDSGVQIRFSPTGTISFVTLVPVSAAPFETRAAIAFGTEEAAQMQFQFASDIRANCQLELGTTPLTWADFRERCIDSEAGDDRALQRALYDVYTARDAVSVDFNGMSLSFQRRTSEQPLLRDGEAPSDTDELFSMSFYRTLDAPVAEFNPKQLAVAYSAALRERLRASVIASGVNTAPEAHPFFDYAVEVPTTMADAPERLGQLVYVPVDDEGEAVGPPTEFVPEVVSTVWKDYRNLDPELQQMLDPRVLDDIYLIEPFVDSVLRAFTYDESEQSNVFKAFRTTDDRRWSIGYAHFIRDEIPYRVVVQYKLDVNSVSAVTVSRGMSEVDELFDGWQRALREVEPHWGDYPYYTLDLAFSQYNRFGLGGDGIVVNGADRRLDMLDVSLAMPGGDLMTLNVSGAPHQDRNGYLRQIGGERWEFVPADIVRLYGRETVIAYYVSPEGEIEAMSQGLFKGQLPLCRGLSLSYGEDVRTAIEAFRGSEGFEAVRDCELVFNYSENGNILNSVASLKNRTAFVVIDGRASSAEFWR